jgi:hypothetical protein
VQVSATRTVDGNRIDVRITVSGLPAGTSAQLTVGADTGKGNVRALDAPGCSTSGKGMTCPVTPASRVFVLQTNNNSGALLTLTVSVPQGWTDPDPGNNRLTVPAAAPGA